MLPEFRVFAASITLLHCKYLHCFVYDVNQNFQTLLHFYFYLIYILGFIILGVLVLREAENVFQ